MYDLDKARKLGAAAAKAGFNVTACPYNYRWEWEAYDAWEDGFLEHAGPEQDWDGKDWTDDDVLAI